MAEKILKSIIFPGLEDTYIVPEQVQPDWNQNDSTAQDYIKNRPFYTGDLVETELLDVNATLEGNGAGWEKVTEETIDGTNYLWVAGVSSSFLTLEEGKEYFVEINGNRHTSVAAESISGTEAICIGDLEAYTSGDISNFTYLFAYVPNQGTEIMYKGVEAPTECKIYSFEPEIVKIDPKFLPEGSVGYTTYDKEGTLLYDTVEVTEQDSYTKIPASLTFIEGETYSVTFNGELYECVAWTSPNNESVICIGNGNIYGGEGKGNNEPFSFDSHNNGVCYLNTPYRGTYRITIDGKSGVYHKIDKKFLPKQIQSNWNENDTRSDCYIANRPFYESLVPTDELLAGSTGWAEAGSQVEISDYSTFIEGKTYLVIFNCVPYECVAWTDSSSDRVFLGNGTINGLENGNNEPFLCSSYGDKMCYLYVPETCLFDISIYPLVSNVVKLDKKFLPNDIIPNSELNVESENPVQNKVVAEAISNLNENINNLNDDINSLSTLVGETPVSEQISNAIAEIPEQVHPDWNQTDETVSDYIKNRTHYTKLSRKHSWDGTPGSLPSSAVDYGFASLPYYRIANETQAKELSNEQLKAANITVYFEINGKKTYSTIDIGDNDYCVFEDDFAILPDLTVLVVRKDNIVIDGIQLPQEAGIYFVRDESEEKLAYVSELVYPYKIKTLPEIYIPDTIARVSDLPNEFSGSWNDLTDKPFEDAIVYEWDESVEYQEYVSIENPFGGTAETIKLAKISNDAPESEFFIGKTCNVWSRTNGESEYITGTIERNHIHTEEGLDGVYLLLDPILVVNTDSYAPEGVPVSRGMWCAHEYIDPSNAITKIQIVVQEGIQLDEKYIPDSIARVSDIPAQEQQVQADWNQTDETATNYIKNKPILATSEEIKALFN